MIEISRRRLFSSIPSSQVAWNLLRNDYKAFKNAFPTTNIPESIASKIGRNLHRVPNHPLNIIKTRCFIFGTINWLWFISLFRIESYCNEYAKNIDGSRFTVYDDENPVVSTKNCFDDLLVAKTHVSRQPSDTYYIDDTQVCLFQSSSGSSLLVCFPANWVRRKLAFKNTYIRASIYSNLERVLLVSVQWWRLSPRWDRFHPLPCLPPGL